MLPMTGAVDGSAVAMQIAAMQGMQMAGGGDQLLYEDDVTDNTIPDIQKISKKNNILPIWGNVRTMNLNALVLENIVQCTYYKNYLLETNTFQPLVDDVYYNVRGVGAGGVVSTAFCILYKMFTIRLTRRQLVSMINSTQSVYLRGMGFMYIRFTQPPADLWAWMEPYLTIDPRSGGGDEMTIAQMVRMMLTKLDWYGTLFPRIPVPIQKEIGTKLAEKAEAESSGRAWDREVKKDRHRPDDREDSRNRRGEERKDKERDSKKGRKTIEKHRCAHHLRHHHCRKHRKKCPEKAKRQKEEHSEKPKESGKEE